MTTWHTRATLAALPVSGWVHLSSPGVAVGSTPAELARLDDVSSATLRAAGVDASDRVLVTLTSDGVVAGPRLARAAVALGATAASISPRAHA